MSETKFQAIEKFASCPNVKTFKNKCGSIVFIKSMTYSSLFKEVVCIDSAENMILLSELLKRGFTNLDEATESDDVEDSSKSK